MNVEKTRKIFGKKAEGKTDQEIKEIIASESGLCDVILALFEDFKKGNLDFKD